jgi:phage terminase small subunit
MMAMTGAVTKPDGLTQRQENFAQHYVLFGVAGDAYKHAYDTEGTANTKRANGLKLLHQPKIAARVRALQTAAGERTLMTTGDLIVDLEEMVNVDVNEVMSLHISNCRHCRGVDYRYQWANEAELEAATEKAIASHGAERMPDALGLFGFDPSLPPVETCPRCLGSGVPLVRLANTADVSRGARRLYKGLELYQDGTVKKILLNDPLAARLELHRVRGMITERSINANVTVDASPVLKTMTRDEQLLFLDSLNKAPT